VGSSLRSMDTLFDGDGDGVGGAGLVFGVASIEGGEGVGSALEAEEDGFGGAVLTCAEADGGYVLGTVCGAVEEEDFAVGLLLFGLQDVDAEDGGLWVAEVGGEGLELDGGGRDGEGLVAGDGLIEVGIAAVGDSEGVGAGG
jgi:hypothetical protein